MMARWAAILFLCGVLWIAFCACAPKATDQIAKIGKEPERPAPAILTVTPWTRWKVNGVNRPVQSVEFGRDLEPGFYVCLERRAEPTTVCVSLWQIRQWLLDPNIRVAP